MKTTYVYKIKNLLEEAYYIGITHSPSRRWAAHKRTANNPDYHHHSIYLYNAMSKHGVDNFEFEVIETLDTRGLANEREKFHISDLKSKGLKIYNISAGGDGVSERIKPIEERNSVSLKLKGENGPAAKLNKNDVSLIREMSTSGVAQTTIAQIIGKVTRESINHVILGATWSEDHMSSEYTPKDLTKEQLLERNDKIKELYKTGNYLPADLAKQFNLGDRVMYTIISRFEFTPEEKEIIDIGTKILVNKKLGGDNASKGKLTWDMVREIRAKRLEDPKKNTLRYLGTEYNVGHAAIKDICNNKSWKE